MTELPFVPIIGEINDAHFLATVASPDKPLLVHSGGGDAEAARGIVEMLAISPRDTIVVGHAYSSALIIFAAGKRRFATPRSRFLFHEPSQSSDKSMRRSGMALDAAELKVWFDFAAKILARGSARTPAFWRRLGTGEGAYFSFDRALELGLVQEKLTRQSFEPLYRALQVIEACSETARCEEDSEQSG